MQGFAEPCYVFVQCVFELVLYSISCKGLLLIMLSVYLICSVYHAKACQSLFFYVSKQFVAGCNLQTVRYNRMLQLQLQILAVFCMCV